MLPFSQILCRLQLRISAGTINNSRTYREKVTLKLIDRELARTGGDCDAR